MSIHKNELLYEAKYKAQHKKYTKEDIKMQTNENVEESICGSQNFCLQLTQDSNTSDIQNINDDKDIIIISDSSSESSCSNPIRTSKSKLTSKKHLTTHGKIYIMDFSDSDSIYSEDEKYFQTWKKNQKSNVIDKLQEKNSIVKRNKVLYTSDESSSSSIEYINEYITNFNKTSSNYINCNPGNNVKSISKTNIQSDSNTVNEKNSFSNCIISNSSSNSKNSNDSIQPTKIVPSIDKIHNGFKKNLSRKDTKNIIKNIKSTRILYESPKIHKKNVILNKEVDDDKIHPAILSENNLKTSNVVIDETPVESDSDIIQGSQVNLTNLYKSHVNKLLNTPHVEKDIGITCTELSDRKKKQIAQWLMVNSPDSQSDTSLGIVPSSNKDNISSGNSSLERLEMNYETPNNRGRIRQLPVSEKEITNPDYNKTSHSTVPRQTTINEFVQKVTNNACELPTSKKCHINNDMFSIPTNSTTNTPQNVEIMDCADILDKLYGKSWRDKADVLLPRTEPRKQISTENRAVQTERKITNKGRSYISDSDDDSNTSLKDLKSQNPSTKKIVKRNIKQKDSFINDRTSSESECESLYYTALTNPKVSLNSVQSKPTIQPVRQRPFAICDTDTEDEGDKDNNQVFNIRRRKLSFSNDENENSSTSEFDPGDDVPPKPIIKQDSTKIVRQILKSNTQIKSNSDKPEYQKYYSFLASLSENVPIANAHPDVKKYRLNYKNNKENLCNYLYKLYNEKVFDKELPEDMTIEWNVRMRGTAGYCYNKKSVKTLGGIVRSSRIVLATKILDTPDRLRDTLIHEMCHAAAWLINCVSDGHGPFWTKWANKAMKTFPELPPIRRCHDYKIKTKFTYKCVNCGYSIGRHSKSLDIEKKRCGHCYGKFELLLNKTTKSGTVQVQTPKREPSAFALYVKENYNSVKQTRNLKHAEVMKVLGQQFSAFKITKKQENVENNSDTPD